MSYDLRGSWNTFADVNAPLTRRSGDSQDFAVLNVQDGMNSW